MKLVAEHYGLLIQHDMVERAISMGGTCTGEHGVSHFFSFPFSSHETALIHSSLVTFMI